MLYVKNTLNAMQCGNASQIEDELWCKMEKLEKETIEIGVVYRPPSASQERNAHIVETLRKVSQPISTRSLLIMGDFNFPSIDWEKNESVGGEATKFLDAVNDNFLVQHVRFCTREGTNDGQSLLDLVITKDEDVENLRRQAPLGQSDHVCILFDFVVSGNQDEEENTRKRNFFKGNYDEFRGHLKDVQWEWEVTPLNQQVETTLNTLTEKHVPMRSKPKPKRLPKYIRRKIKLKHDLYTQYRSTGRPSDREKYRSIRNKVTELLRKNQEEQDLIFAKKAKKCPKLLHKRVRNTVKVKNKVGTLEEDDRQIVKDEEKAVVLSDFFKSVYVEESELDPPPIELRTSEILDDIDITNEKVEALITALDEGKATGPDGVHPKVLKECKRELVEPLTRLFRRSLDTGCVPESWRRAEIAPIFKSGKRSDKTKYRPVSVTSHVSKIAERLLRDEMVEHLERNQLISVSQHGFRKGRSCLTNLLETLEA